jgi:hypothetical protein
MLTQDEITSLWERMLSAEVRALYFADLANRYTRQKQFITGASFFLASGAAAALIGKLPPWVAIVLSCITALLSAYSVARGLDGATRTMAKLHSSWSELAVQYDALWAATYAEEASGQLLQLISREIELSTQAATEAPNLQERMGYWQDYVLRQRHLLPV